MKDVDEKIIDENGNFVFYSHDGKELHDQKKMIKLVACGDTGAVRNLERIVCDKGPLHVLGDMKSVFDKADISYINLESVFANKGTPLDRIPVFRVNPEAFSLIKEINPTVVCLANNHMFDYGPEAFKETVALLQKNKITHFGAGHSLEDALKPAIVEVKGLKIGFIGFREKEAKDFNHNGVITPEIIKDIIIQNIRALRKDVDIIILSLHFGWEYQFYPSPRDVKMCRWFIDEGATIILGHHPHYPQGVEVYKNGMICYSLGNFIWDQNFIGHTNASFAIEIDFNESGVKDAKVIPFSMIRDYQIKIQQRKDDFREINKLSSVLKNERKLDEKWYFISRDKIIVFLKMIKENVRNKKGNWSDLIKILRNTNTNRFRYTAVSLFFYFISLRFLFYELTKRIRRLLGNYE